MIDFKNLRVDKNRKQYTTGKAPHKAVLLLACLKLQEHDRLDLRHVPFDDLNLLETYADLWRCLDYRKPGPIHYPLYHLKSDGFYRLSKDPPVPTNWRPSLKKLREECGHAEFEDDFVAIATDPGGRRQAVEDLLQGGYFSSQEISKLTALLGVLDRSFVYDQELEEVIATDFQMRPVARAHADDQGRDRSFRRTIIAAYKNTCAVCGLSLITANGVTPIQAAHILPFSEFRNDDPRNGLALCTLHHWAFDHFVLSVSPKYRVKVANTIDVEKPEQVLSRFMGKSILLPDEERSRPAEPALEWHNRNRFAV